jgi:serine protease Do
MAHLVLALCLAALTGPGTPPPDKPWTERSTDDARRHAVALPSLAPLVRTVSAAVVNISTRGDPARRPRLPPFPSPPAGDPAEELFKRFSEAEGGPRPHLMGMGTGFIIHPTGYIVTNAHVVEAAETIEVRLLGDDTGRPATVVGLDSPTDLALLKVDGQGLPVIPLGDSDALEVGEFVVAVGNPFGLGHSASFGMVSAKGRRDISPSGRPGLYDFIQTDAAINPGNSGGPLCNLRGEVVGINSAVNPAGQGIGFAVPVNMAKQLLPDLKDRGRVTRGWLGVEVQRVTPELAQGFGLASTQGALVSGVAEGGPAARAGLEVGDVILAMDGKRAEGQDVSLRAAAGAVGTAVTLRVLRDGEERLVRVTLGPRPDERLVEGPGTPATPEWVLGMRVAELDGATRATLGRGAAGVVVREVESGSPAERAGVTTGDVVVKVNGKGVTSVVSWVALAGQVREGGVVKLFLRRGNTGVFVSFPR